MNTVAILLSAFLLSVFALGAFIWSMQKGFFDTSPAAARVIFGAAETGHPEDPAAAQAALAAGDTRFLVISFDSDWRFDTEHSREIVRHLQAGRVPVTFREIESPWGHDSFLLEIPEYDRTVAAFLDRTATDLGI